MDLDNNSKVSQGLNLNQYGQFIIFEGSKTRVKIFKMCFFFSKCAVFRRDIFREERREGASVKILFGVVSNAQFFSVHEIHIFFSI